MMWPCFSSSLDLSGRLKYWMHGVSPQLFYRAMGFTVTRSSWLVQISDTELPISPDSSSDATGFTVAVSINPPRCASCRPRLRIPTLRRILN